MAQDVTTSDLDFVQRHRDIWAARPELRSAYHEFFGQLLSAIGNRRPVVEFGAGPGFFKTYYPALISADVISTSWIDIVCDGCAMPFSDESVGAFVMLDVLHHLTHPLDFIAEAARVLRPGGLIAMIEPWITPASYLLYRYFHHEDCTLSIDIHSHFRPPEKMHSTGTPPSPTSWSGTTRKCQKDHCSLCGRSPFLVCRIFRLAVSSGLDRCRHA
jgi:SAM-dependent methyltransferase